MYNGNINKGGEKMSDKRMRITINFRENEEDKELFEYVLKKSKIMSASAFLKILITEAKIKEEEGK